MPPIIINGYTLEAVQTHGKSTAVQFVRPLAPSHPNGSSKEYLVFVDTNKNGKLDANDRVFNRVVNSHTSNGNVVKRVHSRRTSITPAMIGLYGSHVTTAFRQVQRERAMLMKRLRPQSKGYCAIPTGLFAYIGRTKNFRPPLDIVTRRSKPKAQYNIVNHRFFKMTTVDPARCLLASASVMMPIAGHGQSANKAVKRKVTMMFGPLSAQIIAGRGMMGFSNKHHLVDVFYKNGSYSVDHIDITR